LVFHLDRQGLFRDYLQPKHEELLMPPDQFLGRHYRDVLPEDVSRRLDDAIARLESSLAPCTFEYTLSMPDGLRWYEATVTHFDAPSPAGDYIVIVRNVTADRRALEEAEAQRTLLARLTARVPGVLYLFRQFPGGRSCTPYASERIVEIFEVTPEQVVADGSIAFERIHPDDIEGVRTAIARSYEALTPWRCDFRVTLPKRGERWLRGDAAPERLEDGSVLWHGYIADITDQKRVERALQESETTFRAVFERAGIGMAVVDPDGRLVRANQEFVDLLGYQVPELCGMHGRKLTHPGDYETEKQLFIQMLHGDIPGYQIEKRYIRKDGSIIWGRLTMTLVRTAAREPQFAIGMIENITDRRIAEEALRFSERRFRSLSRLTSDFAYSCTQDESGEYNVDWITDAYCRLTGYSDEDLAREKCWMFVVHPDDREWAVEPIQRLIPGQSDTREFRIVTRDGQLRWFENHMECEADPTMPQSVRIFGAVKDITERKRVEAEREEAEAELRHAQKMEVVGRLAGGVAHDFNNMLGVIIGYAEDALSRLSPEDPLRQDLEGISSAAERSADLTRQLLAFSRKQMISPKSVNLNHVIEYHQKMLLRTIGERIQVEFAPGADLWPVFIDPVQVDQILANLAINARDAIRDTGTVTVATSNIRIDRSNCASYGGARDGDYVLLSVSDTGQGMNAEVRDRIFEPFFTTKELGKGTGLGLSTVYGIVRQNDGFVAVSSQVGKGTTLKVLFPRHLGELEHVVPAPRTKTESGSETILVVEDEERLLQLIQRLLIHQGYTVLTASSPDDACLKAERAGANLKLLLTDVVMPSMNGKELSEKISEIVPGVRVVFMSGYAGDVTGSVGIREATSDFIAKPFSVVELTAKLREVLDRA
jgi:PAS domain S-box-containing protein